MTGLPLFSEKKMRGARLFSGFKISHLPLCRPINIGPSLTQLDFFQFKEKEEYETRNTEHNLLRTVTTNQTEKKYRKRKVLRNCTV